MSAVVGGLVVSGLTQLGNKIIEKRRYEQQKSDQQRAWRLNNEYNSPSAQMARLQAAGLSPNLVYQNGAATPTSDTMNVPDYKTSPLNDYTDLAPQIMQSSSIEAQNELVKAQTAELRSDTAAKDSPYGTIAAYNLLQDEQKEFFASQYGLDSNAVRSLSLRSFKYLVDIENLSQSGKLSEQNRKNLKQTLEILKNNTNTAETESARAFLAFLLDSMNVNTEAQKHGFSTFSNYHDSLGAYNRDLDIVFQTFLREYKEKHWQSSDFKHYLDSFNQTLGNLPSVFNLFKKGDWSKKFSKENFK